MFFSSRTKFFLQVTEISTKLAKTPSTCFQKFRSRYTEKNWKAEKTNYYSILRKQKKTNRRKQKPIGVRILHQFFESFLHTQICAYYPPLETQKLDFFSGGIMDIKFLTEPFSIWKNGVKSLDFFSGRTLQMQIWIIFFRMVKHLKLRNDNTLVFFLKKRFVCTIYIFNTFDICNN